MALLYLIRHGRAAGGWTEDPDPGLDEEGHDQARAMAAAIGPTGPLGLVASPLRRTRLTAAALETAWGTEARIDPRVGEIPSPAGPEGELANRGAWLASVMSTTWDDPALDPSLRAWRRGVLAALGEVSEDTAVVSHFVVINAAVGAATGDQRVMSFRPGYCSVTVLDNAADGLRLVELGGQSTTLVR
ncbi:MAG TPA: histidine phosphatase family protein [Acidimicrobiales bacterium]|nr:histidine phosphatase family protein [Acidimicrobiales bacterium]